MDAWGGQPERDDGRKSQRWGIVETLEQFKKLRMEPVERLPFHRPEIRRDSPGYAAGAITERNHGISCGIVSVRGWKVGKTEVSQYLVMVVSIGSVLSRFRVFLNSQEVWAI
jgi:hypothetical protein